MQCSHTKKKKIFNKIFVCHRLSLFSFSIFTRNKPSKSDWIISLRLHIDTTLKKKEIYYFSGDYWEKKKKQGKKKVFFSLFFVYHYIGHTKNTPLC